MNNTNASDTSSGSTVSSDSSPTGEGAITSQAAPARSGDQMDFPGDLPLSETQTVRLDTLADLMNYTCHFVHHYSGKRGQGRILSLLSREGAMTQHEMQSRLNIQSGSLSEILTKLENAGFITRQRDAADRRRQIIAITEAGQADLDEHRARRLHRQRLLYSDLTEEEQEDLIRILRKLHESWKKFPPQGQSDGCRCQKTAGTGNRQGLSNPDTDHNPEDSGTPNPGTNHNLEDSGNLQSLQDAGSTLNQADPNCNHKTPDIAKNEHREAQKI